MSVSRCGVHGLWYRRGFPIEIACVTEYGPSSVASNAGHGPTFFLHAAFECSCVHLMDVYMCTLTDLRLLP